MALVKEEALKGRQSFLIQLEEVRISAEQNRTDIIHKLTTDSEICSHLHSGCFRGSLCAFACCTRRPYLSSQLQTLVSVVIAIVHLVVALSENYPAHHHSQVDTFRSEVKLLHLRNTVKTMHLNKMISQIYDSKRDFKIKN